MCGHCQSGTHRHNELWPVPYPANLQFLAGLDSLTDSVSCVVRIDVGSHVVHNWRHSPKPASLHSVSRAPRLLPRVVPPHVRVFRGSLALPFALSVGSQRINPPHSFHYVDSSDWLSRQVWVSVTGSTHSAGAWDPSPTTQEHPSLKKCLKFYVYGCFD